MESLLSDLIGNEEEELDQDEDISISTKDTFSSLVHLSQTTSLVYNNLERVTSHLKL